MDIKVVTICGSLRYAKEMMRKISDGKEEIELFHKMTNKVKEILRQEKKKEETPKRVRKISIE